MYLFIKKWFKEYVSYINRMRIYLKKYENLVILEINEIIKSKKGLKHDLLLLFRKIAKVRYNRIHHDKQLAYMKIYSKKKYHDDVDGYRLKGIAQINAHYVKVIKGVKDYKKSDKLIELFSKKNL